MPLFVEHRRSSLKKHGEPVVLDLTSRGPEPWLRFSPFYPHGSIPIPFSPGQFGASVEGIWQGLKVFEKAGVDRDVMAVTTMKGIKRSVRRFGNVLGHRAGLDGDRLLPYLEARRQIYLPCYLWVLETNLADLVDELDRLTRAGQVVLLDFQTNSDVENVSSPLSHAALVKRYVEGDWPGTKRFHPWKENIDRQLKASQWYADIQARISPALKTQIVALVSVGETVDAMRKLHDAGVSWQDCTNWVHLHCPPSRPHPKPISCPYCGKLLKTMIAKQCLECGMDWHDPNNVVRHSAAGPD